MEAHQQRVVNECADLDWKLCNLIAFFQTPRFALLDSAEQGRLQRQAEVMAEYSQILMERIAAF